MQASQQVIGQFRQKRLLISAIAAISALILLLTFHFFEGKREIEQQSKQVAGTLITHFEQLLSPLDVSASGAQALIGLSCIDARGLLVEKQAMMQTVRAILLVDHDKIYCSSLYGEQDIPFSTTYPELAIDNQRMLLGVDHTLLKGSTVLFLWTPGSLDNRTGVLQAINIEMLSHYLLEPALPWVNRAILNVGGKKLEYRNPDIKETTSAEHEVGWHFSSQRYPFSITLFGRSPSQLALSTLPIQVPLALMLSLTMGYIVWLATSNRMSLSWQISYGISAREFMVYCQPLINARNGVCEGIELLLRWHHPRLGWIPPDVFIPMAERQNLITPLTRFVISEAIRYLPILPATPSFYIALNVAASHFRDCEIINDLQALLWKATPGPQLVVELTERDALPIVDQQVVSRLQKMGIKLAIDDFGTGHSSLSYLRTLNPDILKIDKLFTAAIGTDAVNVTVIDMVIALAQRLNISLVAEGVETEEQANYLSEHRVNTLQGYFYARPMPLGDFQSWLTNSPPREMSYNTNVGAKFEKHHTHPA